MKTNRFYVFLLVALLLSCSSDHSSDIATDDDIQTEIKYANIDFNHWKVTLPIPRSDTDSRPLEIKPPEILNYRNIDLLQEFMYDDTTDQSIVFFTRPGSTTANSNYSRTELREQMTPGSNDTNWTFPQGGTLEATLKMNRVSGNTGQLDRVIVLQIHGRLTDEQRDMIEEDDHNAPPVLKIYWDNGRINVRRKVLVDESVDDVNILRTSSWTDESHWFQKEVGFDPFQIKIIASDGRLEVDLVGEDESFAFQDIHTEKWNVFENYFKAGTYLISTHEQSFAEVKFYDLVVQH